MGTHPIFESDFDCLTDYINMSEAVNRIRSPIDEFAAKKEDYALDSSIKIGAGLFVGSVIGLATRRLVRVRYPMLIGGSMGAGMALERYSYQLSAPYTNPPSTPVDPKAPILTNTALPLGALWSAIFPEAKAEPVVEAVAETPAETVAEEPVAAVEEVVEAPAEETTQEAPVDAVVEAVEDVVSEVADVVEEVVEAALDVVQEVRETVAEAAEEVKEVAEEVIQAAVVVEDVSEKIDEIVKIELVEEVEAQAKEVEHVAEEVKEVAAEIVEATKQ